MVTSLKQLHPATRNPTDAPNTLLKNQASNLAANLKEKKCSESKILRLDNVQATTIMVLATQ